MRATAATSRPAHAGRRRHGRRSWLVDWAVPFVLFALVLGAWSVASPLGSSADEGTTIARAAAIVRGELTGARPRPGTPEADVILDVTVPATFARTYHACYVLQPTVTAECAMPPDTTSRVATTVGTLVGRYPPLYYLVVGLPSYLPGGIDAVVAMRWAGDLLNAALLALAVAAVRRYGEGRWPVVGLSLAISPMVLYFGSVINPSGLELASTICLWVAAALWADRPGPAPLGLVWITAASAAVVVQSRPASLAWPILIAITVAPLARRTAAGRGVPGGRGSAGLIVPGLVALTSAAAAAVWFVTEHPLVEVSGNPPAPGTSTADLVRHSVALMPSYLEQGVGRLGWLDVFLPLHIVSVWLTAAAALLAAALVLGHSRQRLAVTVAMLWSFAVPVIGTLAAVHARGFSSQGRYFLPLFVGMPIVSSVVIGRALAERRPRADPSGAAATAVVVGVVACAQIAVFGSTLRRYLVGTDGPILPWVRTQGAWHPPVPATALDVVAAVALLGLAVHMAAGRPAPPPTRHGRRRRPQSRRALEPVIE